SSTSRSRPSFSSPGRRRASSGPASPGEAASGRGLGARALRDLAARHGVRPKKSLGQHFLVDPNLARGVVADAGVEPGDRVLEIGAGLGSLTVALADRGAEITAVEVDRRAVEALREL